MNNVAIAKEIQGAVNSRMFGLNIDYAGISLLEADWDKIEDVPADAVCILTLGWEGARIELSLQDTHELICGPAQPLFDKGILVLGRRAFVRLKPLRGSAGFGLVKQSETYLGDGEAGKLENLVRTLGFSTRDSAGNSVTGVVCRNPTAYNFRVAVGGYGYEGSRFHDCELGLVLEFERTPTEQNLQHVLQAYLYAVGEKGFELHIEAPESSDFDNEEPLLLPDVTNTSPLELVAGMVEPSIQPMLKQYEKGLMRLREEDYEVGFLCFFKVLEHASGVVAGQEVRGWVQKGSAPTARSVRDLANKLSEEVLIGGLLKALDLPNTLTLNAQRLGSSQKSLGAILSVTRNYLSHAKAGYEVKGGEILERNLPAGCELVREVARRTLNWYSVLPLRDKLA
jgi:hypothetical protein